MSAKSAEPEARSAPPERITSIDALRGVVMLVMIFVNDLGDVPGDIVPAWMKHYRGENGMTFVDLVFPAFLFIVGMSIPFALNSRLKKGESPLRIFFHVLIRAVSLLFLGILMVNGRPDTDKMGWSGWLWCSCDLDRRQSHIRPRAPQNARSARSRSSRSTITPEIRIKNISATA